MNEAGRRAARTLLQGMTAGMLISLYQALSPWPMSATQMAAVGPVLSIVLTAAMSVLQNTAEDKGFIPTVLKTKVPTW